MTADGRWDLWWAPNNDSRW